MKRWMWSAIGIVALAAVIWAGAEIAAPRQEVAPLMPDGALLYLEAKDFRGLLKDWNDSQEKRAWLKGDDYAAFSRSRLFERLSQAGDEFAAAASLATDNAFLSSVAGKQSALALYDIGNLEFVYVTRMDESAVETTPLWQARSKFEPRREGVADFYIHKDTQSNRTAAFAVRDGWLVLGTREDLVTGVLDRILGTQARALPDEAWFADAVKTRAAPADDLRMVLNLEKIVPSPYFRSYWVQRNITEMKQYRAALCDLHRTQQLYREDRVLLRKPGVDSRASGDVQSLASLAPDDAGFYSAQASPDGERVLSELRENLLDVKAAQARAAWTAPVAATAETAGTASLLEERIDVAPAIVKQSDPYQPLRALLNGAQPAAMLEVYSTRTPQNEMFVNIDRAIVIEASQNWDEAGVKSALTAALRPALTASQMGVQWIRHENTGGSYSALDGPVRFYMAVRGRQLFVGSNQGLIERLLTQKQKPGQAQDRGVTYAAVFRHAPREQRTFRKLVNRIDHANHASNTAAAGEENADGAQGQAPPFFSGNMASLSNMFARVSMESIQEKDQGSQVSQTVVYQWQHP